MKQHIIIIAVTRMGCEILCCFGTFIREQFHSYISHGGVYDGTPREGPPRCHGVHECDFVGGGFFVKDIPVYVECVCVDRVCVGCVYSTMSHSKHTPIPPMLFVAHPPTHPPTPIPPNPLFISIFRFSPSEQIHPLLPECTGDYSRVTLCSCIARVLYQLEFLSFTGDTTACDGGVCVCVCVCERERERGVDVAG